MPLLEAFLAAKAAEEGKKEVVESPFGRVEVRPTAGDAYEDYEAYCTREEPDPEAPGKTRRVFTPHFQAVVAVSVYDPGTGKRLFQGDTADETRRWIGEFATAPVALVQPILEAYGRLGGREDAPANPPTGTAAGA